MIARPTVPPTWRIVCMTPEASPRSAEGAVFMASVEAGVMTIASPSPDTT